MIFGVDFCDKEQGCVFEKKVMIPIQVAVTLLSPVVRGYRL